MDNLSKIKRFKNIKENPQLYIPKEFDRVDNDLETLKQTDKSIASDIVTLDQKLSDTVNLLKEELETQIHDIELIPPEKGDKGDDYVLTEQDKKEIANSIKVPIVEKVVEKIIEKTETIKEVPIVTENIVEIIKEDVSGETIIDRINLSESKISSERVEGIKSYDDEIATLQNRTQLLAQISTQNKRDTLQSVTDNGATTTNKITVPRIQFDVTATPATNAEGLLQWNATDGTLDLGMQGGDITMQIGQELFTKVRNEAGYETISNGQVVYISGRNGVFPTVRKARADSDATSRVLGIATEDIVSPAFGYITTLGYIRGIKTNYTGAGIWGTTWVTGDLLYVSKTNAGVLTNVEPSVPHHSDTIGTVGVVSANQGSILVTLDRHKTLEQLTDVNGTPLATTGQMPVWNNTSGYFDFNYNITNYHKNSYRAITALRTLDDSDEFVDCTANSFTVTLPTAVGFTKKYIVFNSGTGNITFSTTNGELVNGVLPTDLSLSQYEEYSFRSNNVGWYIVG